MAAAPSSGSSRTSTPSQPGQRKLPPPPPRQPSRPPPAREAGKGPGSAAAPPAPHPWPAQKPPVSKQHKTQKSPVRIPFMQKPAKKPFPARRSAMPVLEEQAGGGLGEPRPRVGACRSGSLGLVRMASARSAGSESDRSGFLRQLTFIKESSGLLLRHRPERPASEGPAPRAPGGSPRRGRLGLPAVFLCSSRCEDLKAEEQPAGPAVSRVPPSQRAAAGARPPRRTSSESPSRLPVKTSGAPPEPFKRYSSSPQINVARRSASPSAVAPCCPEPFGGEKTAKRSEEVPKLPVVSPPAPPPPPPGTEDQPQARVRGTWKRIRDEDIPHILKSTLPSTALPLVSAPKDEEARKSWGALPRKTSDAVVQTEDFAAAPKTNSSTSPTLESPKAAPGEAADAFGPGKAAFAHEAPVGSFPPSRHSSPSRAARVTPFNYTPSPMVGPTAGEKQAEKVQV